MSTSLPQLKAELMSKGGYTGTPGHGNLVQLRSLVNNMISVRSSGMPAACDTVDRAGVTCTGHTSKSSYDSPGLSLGDVRAFSQTHLKGCTCENGHGGPDCTCHTESACDCVTRGTCSCNNREVCNCDYDDCTCDTHSYCLCRNRTAQDSCKCHVDQAGGQCSCEDVYQGEPEYCDCHSREAEDACREVCDEVSSGGCSYNCDCQGRESCDTVNASCTCVDRTGCECNLRCNCNTQKLFG